jgi:hypothetical protein
MEFLDGASVQMISACGRWESLDDASVRAISAFTAVRAFFLDFVAGHFDFG